MNGEGNSNDNPSGNVTTSELEELLKIRLDIRAKREELEQERLRIAEERLRLDEN